MGSSLGAIKWDAEQIATYQILGIPLAIWVLAFFAVGGLLPITSSLVLAYLSLSPLVAQIILITTIALVVEIVFFFCKGWGIAIDEHAQLAMFVAIYVVYLFLVIKVPAAQYMFSKDTYQLLASAAKVLVK